MEASKRPRVKICCIKSLEEAWMAIHHGASAIGLVSEMPSGPGVISEEEIAAITARTPPGVATFLLTSRTRVEEIIDQQQRCRANTLQLVDRLTEGSHQDLRRALPGIALVQVIHITGPTAIDEALAAAEQVDALLLDSGNPSQPVKELGGTGRTHDWSLSREIRRRAQIPTFLAGGLRPENVAAAITAVRPYGVDICSGLRSHEALDETALRAFMSALDSAC